MNKRTNLHILMASLFLATAAASPAVAGNVYAGMSPLAQETAENVIYTLENSGYTIVSIRRTLLRRLHITAANGAQTREVVVSRTTGEIKRDSVMQIASAQDSNTFNGGGDDDNARTASDGDKDKASTADDVENGEVN